MRQKVISLLFVFAVLIVLSPTNYTFAKVPVTTNNEEALGDAYESEQATLKDLFDRIESFYKCVDAEYTYVLNHPEEEILRLSKKTYYDERAAYIISLGIDNSYEAFLRDSTYISVSQSVASDVRTASDNIKRIKKLNNEYFGLMGYKNAYESAKKIYTASSKHSDTRPDYDDLLSYAARFQCMYGQGFLYSVNGLYLSTERLTENAYKTADFFTRRLDYIDGKILQSDAKRAWDAEVNDTLYTDKNMINPIIVEENVGGETSKFIVNKALDFALTGGIVTIFFTGINVILLVIGVVLYLLLDIFGIALDNIVFGRLFSHGTTMVNLRGDSAYTSLFSFGFETGNAYGLIAMKVYRIINGYAYLIIATVAMFMLLKNIIANRGDINNRARNAAKSSVFGLKELLVCFLCSSMCPIILELVLQVRDLAIYYICGDAMSALFGAKEFPSLIGFFTPFDQVLDAAVVSRFLNDATGLGGTIKLVLWISVMGASFSFLFQYIGYAISAIIHMWMFPLVCVQRLWSPPAIRNWSKSFASIIMLPFVDCLMLLIPAALHKMAVPMSSDAANVFNLLSMISVYCIKPCRQTAFRMLGLSEQQLGAAAEGAGKAMAQNVVTMAKVAAAVATAGAAGGSALAMAQKGVSAASGTVSATDAAGGTEGAGPVNTAKGDSERPALTKKERAINWAQNNFSSGGLMSKARDAVLGEHPERDIQKDIESITSSDYGRTAFSDFTLKSAARERVAKQAGVLMSATGGLFGAAMGMASGADTSQQFAKAFSNLSGHKTHEAVGRACEGHAFNQVIKDVNKENKRLKELERDPSEVAHSANFAGNGKDLASLYSDNFTWVTKDEDNQKLPESEQYIKANQEEILSSRAESAKNRKNPYRPQRIVDTFSEKTGEVIKDYARTGDRRILKKANSPVADLYAKEYISFDPVVTNGQGNRQRIPGKAEDRVSLEKAYKRAMEPYYERYNERTRGITRDCEKREIAKDVFKRGDIIRDTKLIQEAQIAQDFADRMRSLSRLDSRITLSENDEINDSMFMLYGKQAAGTWASDKFSRMRTIENLRGKGCPDGTPDLLSYDYILDGLDKYNLLHKNK